MSVRIITGDCRDVLPTLRADSFDCIVTSPPYWGLRDYGVDGQIGLEPTLTEYLETMVGVMREARRVLKPSGTCWLNIGDSYAGSGRGDAPTPIGGFRPGNPAKNGGVSNRNGLTHGHGMKAKDLCMVPNRLALLLQEDGWYVRSEIIWAKPNPMPESVADRPTCSHEKLWLLTKSGKYFYDADSIREPLAPSSVSRLSQDIEAQIGSMRANGGGKTNGSMKAVSRLDKQRGHSRRHDGFNDRWDAMSKAEQQAAGSNARNVWTIASEPYRGAHYAVMPSALAERCIKAGCPPGGSVLDPFGGAGTTGLVADRLGRHATLIELNPANREMAADRVTMDGPLFAEVGS